LLLIAPIKQLTTVSTTIQRGLAASQNVFALLDTPTENDTGTVALGRAKGHIRFESVCFQYPGTNRLALNSVDLDIAPGQTLALVGTSGGGKSTLGAVLPRFYALNSGRISIDSVDITDITLKTLRENISLVSQDVVLFNDTIAANIAYGSLTIHTQAEIEEAARSAYAFDFIQTLPEGFDSVVGENGAKLSGGQRQRIAIARAILKNAPILILDEATSALDTESERQVQAALTVLMKGRTTIVIAHRLSTIEHADNIVVLHEGQIVETGTHSQLLGKAGYYANLSKLQP
jgi:ATP-binding cassette, subfamily B, bacterial MsbA